MDRILNRCKLSGIRRIFRWLVPLVIAAALLGGLLYWRSVSDSVSGAGGTGSVTLSGAFALYPLAVQWAGEFTSQHPDIKVDVSSGGAGKGITDVMNGMVDFAMLSREPHEEELSKGAVAYEVGRDAVIPVLNSSNPLIEQVMARGITAEEAGKIWITGEISTWGQLLGTSDRHRIKVFSRSDACGAAQTFAAWFGATQEDMGGTAVYGDPGVASAVKGDIWSIGFNNMAYAYDVSTGRLQDGMAAFPIDIDGDGHIVPEENFYSCKDSLVAAILDGRFPAPPSRSLYLVSNGAPSGEAASDFLKYVLTDGQELNGPNGYVSISEEESDASLRSLRRSLRSGGVRRDNSDRVLYAVAGIVLLLYALFSGFLLKSTLNGRRIYKERFSSAVMFILTMASVLLLLSMLAGLFIKAWPILRENSLADLLTTGEWKPSQGRFGFLPFIGGSLYVTLLAMVFSFPVSLLTAVFLTEYAPAFVRKCVYPALDILASLPSVIYGVWGVLTLIPLFGYSLLTGALVLCVMVLPIQISLFVEIFSTVSSDLRDASTALGATTWQTAKKVVLRKSLPGIFAAVVLALSKCVGETIAVMMVCGSVMEIPSSVFSSFNTLPALIGNNYGEMASIPLYESAIMFAALLLMLIVLLFNVISRIILYRIQKTAN